KDAETEVDTCSAVELCTECAGKVRNLIFGSFAKIFTNTDGTVHKVELPKVETVAAALEKVSKAAEETKKMIPKMPAALKKAVKAAEEAKVAAEPTTPPQKVAPKDEEWANEVREMLKNGKTVHEIALHYGLNKSTTYNRMNHLGISPKQFRPR
ncbi:MAG: hypothetical protein IJV71_02875, partial [Lachnospiraceae bacterium]|nr:hypothetical protein [Lachnospiraceae bacterium]